MVAAPGDPLEVRALTRALVDHPGRVFCAWARRGTNFARWDSSLEVGEVIEVRGGNDVVLLSTGGMLEIALQVVERLAQQGVDAGVTSVPFLKPLNTALCHCGCATVAAFVVRSKSMDPRRAWAKPWDLVWHNCRRSRRAVAVQPARGQYKRGVWRSTLFAGTRRSRSR